MLEDFHSVDMNRGKNETVCVLVCSHCWCACNSYCKVRFDVPTAVTVKIAACRLWRRVVW
jgi:hypothetical protein